MTSKSSSRHSRRKSKPSILVSDVKYNSTCLSLDLPLSLCCDVSCHPYLESQSGLLKKSSHGSKRFRDLSDRRRCKQPWASVHNNAYKTTSTLRNYVRVRNYMQIDCDVTLDNFYSYSTSTKKSKVEEKELTLKYNAEEASSSSQVHTKVNSPNRIIEASQPSPPPHPLITVPVDTNTNALPSSPSITPAVAPVHRSTLPPLPIECCPKCRSILQEYIDNLKGWGPTDPPSGQQAVPTRPNNLYTTVLKREYKQLERDAIIGRKIRRYVERDKKQFTGTSLGKRLYASAVVLAPRIGLATLAKIFSLASAGTLASLGLLQEYLPSLALLTPSPVTLKSLVVELGVDVVLLISNDVKDKELSLICDKGEDKGPSASFIKLLCWHDNLNKQVEVICFGIESAGSTSKDAAKAINHSLRLFEYSSGTRLHFKSSTTDAGGGGTNESLVKELVTVDRAVNDCNYDWVNCVLHALNLMLQCPIEAVFGAGGLKKRTFMQMLHTCYTLKGLYPIKTWREMWILATGTIWVDIKCPVLSRWEHVGEASQHVEKYKNEWISMATYIIQMNNVGTNKNDIASYLYSYLKEDVLYSHLLFVNGFITGFFDKHLQWHKRICPKSKRAGFRAIDMAVNHYVMHRDLQDIKANWRTKDFMAAFVRTYPDNAEYKKENMVSDFFDIVEHRMKKHLTKWRTKHLPFALAGDALPAAYIANWLMGKSTPAWIPETYQSQIHNTTINVRACGTFLCPPETRPDTYTTRAFYTHLHQIQRIAAGIGTLWDETSLDMEPFRIYVRKSWLKIATNSQLAERWVKDSNECTYTSKDERMSNIYAIIRSRTVMCFNDIANTDHKDRIRKGTKYMTKGKLGTRTDKRTGALEIVNEKMRDDIRGSMLISTIIKRTIQQLDDVLSLNVSDDIRLQVWNHLTDDTTQFDTTMRNEVTESLASILHKPPNPDNAIMKIVGVDATPHARREVRYSKCLKKHIELIRSELLFRSVEFREEDGIMALKRLLKAHENDRQAAEILLNSNAPARPEEINGLFFKPLHRPAVEWRDAFHVE